MLALRHSLFNSLRIIEPGSLAIWTLSGGHERLCGRGIKESFDQYIGFACAMNGRGISAGVIDSLPCRSQMLGVTTALLD
jgi:hypothetical protein